MYQRHATGIVCVAKCNDRHTAMTPMPWERACMAANQVAVGTLDRPSVMTTMYFGTPARDPLAAVNI